MTSTAILAAVSTFLAGILAGIGGIILQRRYAKVDRAREVLGKYRDPLLRAAYELQRRLYEIVRGSFVEDYSAKEKSNEGESSKSVDQEGSTLWLFAQYLGWVEILRSEVEFLDLGTVRKNRELQRHLHAVAVALAADRKDVGKSFATSGAEQRAIGEFMVVGPASPRATSRPRCLGYREFTTKLAVRKSSREGPFERWGERLRMEMSELSKPSDLAGSAREGHVSRLVLVQRALVDLMDGLDPEQERYPLRDLRGKIMAPPPQLSERLRIARFDFDGDPWPIVEPEQNDAAVRKAWASAHRIGLRWAKRGRVSEVRRYGPTRGWLRLGSALELIVRKDREDVTIVGFVATPGYARKMKHASTWVGRLIESGGSGSEFQPAPESGAAARSQKRHAESKTRSWRQPRRSRWTLIESRTGTASGARGMRRTSFCDSSSVLLFRIPRRGGRNRCGQLPTW